MQKKSQFLSNRLTVSTWGETGELLEHTREMMRIIKAEALTKKDPRLRVSLIDDFYVLFTIRCCYSCSARQSNRR